MPTPAQQTASRQNGAQSTGPVTPEGRAKASKNSQKHGLCAKTFTLDTPEDQAHFDQLLQDLTFTHQVKHPAEQEACHTLAVATWRRRICDKLEAELLRSIENGTACAQSGGDGLPSLNTICRYRARISRDIVDAKDELKALRAERAKAFEAEMTKAREMSDKTMLNGLINHMGLDAFQTFRTSVANPERTNPTPAQATENTEKTDPARAKKLAKNKAQKQARKTTQKNRK